MPIIYGGAGDDTIDGGAGDDLLTGGEGEDVFFFDTDGGNDTITDFSVTEDVIDLRDCYQGISSFSDLTIRQDGDDALIDLSANGGGTIRLEDVRGHLMIRTNVRGVREAKAMLKAICRRLREVTGRHAVKMGRRCWRYALMACHHHPSFFGGKFYYAGESNDS